MVSQFLDMFAALDVKAQHFVLQILMLCIILDGKIKSKEMALFHVRSSPDTAHIMSDLGFALPVQPANLRDNPVCIV